MSTIADSIPRVRKKLGNRMDIDERITTWLRDAYIEIGTNYNFAELEDKFEDVLTIGTDTYAYPTMDVAKGSAHDNFETRAIRHLTLILSNGTPRPLKRRNMKHIDLIPVTPAAPVIYGREGRTVIFRPSPDYAYTLRWRVWVRPLMADPLHTTEVLLPQDWMEIFELAAIMRGHSDLGEPDKASQTYEILHGGTDPNTGRRWPGLIAQRQTQRIMEVGDENYAFEPPSRNYSSR